MKPLVTFFFIVISISVSYCQKSRVELYSTRIDTLPSGEILQSVSLILKDVKKSSYELGYSKILTVTAQDQKHQSINADSVYSSFQYRKSESLFAAFQPIKLNSINGVIRYLRPTEENKSIIKIDSILQHENKIIFQKKNLKVAVINLESLRLKKSQSQKEYNKMLKSISRANKLDDKVFELALEEILVSHWEIFEYMIYCEDLKNTVVYIDSLDVLKNVGPAGITEKKFKVAFFKKDRNSNSVTLILENKEALEDIPFHLNLEKL